MFIDEPNSQFGTFTNTTNQLVLGAVRTVTITAPTPASSSRTHTIPDISGNGTFAFLEGTQTFSGSKTFSSSLALNADHVFDITGFTNTFLRVTGTAITGQWTFFANNNEILDLSQAKFEYFIPGGTIEFLVDATQCKIIGIPLLVTQTSNQIVLGTTKTTTITVPTPSASNVYTMSDVGATGTFAFLEGTQTFSGAKTFSSTITGSISGNAGTVTNGVYTTGDLSIAGIKTFTGQLIGKGTTTNDNASAGYIGEYVEATFSAQSVSTSGVFFDAASISLTAGDWDVQYHVDIVRNGATFTGTDFEIFIGSTSGNSTAGRSLGVNSDDEIGLVPTTFTIHGMVTPKVRISLASTTTYYAKTYVDVFTAGNPTVYGVIRARRVR